MKSLFEPETMAEVRLRLEALKPDSPRAWGKMTPAQMLCHCQAPLNIMLKRKDYGLKPMWLVSLLFKKSLYNDKPVKKNLPTPKSLKQTEERDFQEEFGKLTQLLDEVKDQSDRGNWGTHPVFGKFTDEQWGKMQYKHLDHHLTQFGV